MSSGKENDSQVKYSDEDDTSDYSTGEEEGKVEEVISSTTSVTKKKRLVPNYDVKGVFKVVLGEETQMLIDLVVGTHVNAQYPWRFVSKEKIMESILLNGVAAEFYPFADKLKSYSDEHVLMGYIVDESNDVDEFYVCYTIKARDHCKRQSDKFIRRQEKLLEKAVQKIPRPWKSLGSEIEINELIPVNTRTLIELEIKAKFPKKYEPKNFITRDTESVRDGYIELTPYRQKFNNVFKRRIDCASQAAPPVCHRYAQTELRYPQNKWTQSIADALGKVNDVEGGGDAGIVKSEISDISTDEKHETVGEQVDDVGFKAYKAAMSRMRRPSYIKQMTKFMVDKCTEMESIIELNTVMDMYFNDYANLVSEKTADIYDSMTFEEYVCFTDVKAKDKFISCATFHPMWTGIVAICYSDDSPNVMRTVRSRQDPVLRAVYGLNPVLIWSHVDSLLPKIYLESPREVKVLSFCPFDENILIGGCINGQVVVWDLTNKLENIENIEVLSETKEKYRIAMNAHMGWIKNIHNNAVVPSTALSNLMTSHYGQITAINWLSPNFIVTPTGKFSLLKDNKKSMMFFTGSEDGVILIWNLSVENVSQFDTKKIKKSKRVLRRPSGLLVDVSPLKILDRNLQPCYKVLLGFAGQPQVKPLQSFGTNIPNIEYINSPRIISRGRKYYVPNIIAQSENEINKIFYLGSQYGELVKFTWEGHEFNTGEVVNSEYSDIKFSCNLHDGIVTCTEKNPFIEQITLTVGGKIFAIWSDKLANRPLIWKKRNCRLTAGKWSLYKPSLLFIVTSEGDLETWDILLKSDKPIAVQTVSGNMLTGVSLHTLPIAKNMIGVCDENGSFRIFLNPPIFMIENPSYLGRMQSMIIRELKVMQTFIAWQDKWVENNPETLLEIKKKEGELLALKEEEKRRAREEQEKKLEVEAEARRLQNLKVVGPEERWQNIIQKLIERTIAVKKRINRAELIEQEKPLRELEAQRLEKERRMVEIMKNQKTIFNDTVAILFPEAIKKEEKVKKSFLSDDKETIKKMFFAEYEETRLSALKTVADNPYNVSFSWDGTLAEGKERKQTLNAHEDYIKLHRNRLHLESTMSGDEQLNRRPLVSDSESTLDSTSR